MAIRENWDQEELELLTRAKRNSEIVKGIVRTVGFRKMPVVNENGRVETKEIEVAIINLAGGVTAYCPASEISEREFKSLTGFAGTIQEVIIDRLDLENQIATVSVKQADKIKAENFWSELTYLEKKGELQDKTYEGIVTGYNAETNNIFVRISGVDTFMSRADWDHGFVPNLSEIIDRGEKIEIKIRRFDAENKLVQVSRKAARVDPFDFLKECEKDKAIVARVTEVHPIHGIFVKMDNNLEVKAMKPRSLPEPIVDDIVSVRVHSIDYKNRRAKVVMIDYPQGKKKRKDVAGFLFE
ncbi:30S ribosomal protein S1 [Alkalihalobacillus sp. BA299]|uniref:30S ribosomal protein S1 n=1 Tax=Alkalihalobacillus sp. BA299 TaxID=2815938 RepID=UPI001FFE1D8B|nr:30S ribosomal protein S1 [Alkalihalobacillus sp. BA299]